MPWSTLRGEDGSGFAGGRCYGRGGTCHGGGRKRLRRGQMLRPGRHVPRGRSKRSPFHHDRQLMMRQSFAGNGCYGRGGMCHGRLPTKVRSVCLRVRQQGRRSGRHLESACYAASACSRGWPEGVLRCSVSLSVGGSHGGASNLNLRRGGDEQFKRVDGHCCQRAGGRGVHEQTDAPA